MRDLTLYERTAKLMELDRVIGDADGEITPEQEAEMEALAGSVNEKAEAVAAKRAELLATASVCEEEADRLTRRAKTLTARAKWLDGYLLAQLTLAGITKVQGERFTISRVLNPPRAIVVADPPVMRSDVEALPEPLRACVTITPPKAESYAWDKAALVALSKIQPDAVQGVATIDRTERVNIT